MSSCSVTKMCLMFSVGDHVPNNTSGQISPVSVFTFGCMICGGRRSAMRSRRRRGAGVSLARAGRRRRRTMGGRVDEGAARWDPTETPHDGRAGRRRARRGPAARCHVDIPRDLRRVVGGSRSRRSVDVSLSRRRRDAAAATRGSLGGGDDVAGAGSSRQSRRRGTAAARNSRRRRRRRRGVPGYSARGARPSS